MKRGLITWDKNEIPPHVFETRLESVRRVLRAQNLASLVVYSELWRSNHGRYFSNFMPYFNRALLILPVEAKPTLLCGLSPRVYSWIRSVTTIEDVRPAGNFAKPLLQLAEERGWNRIGLLDAQQLPYDMSKALHAAATSLEMVAIAAEDVCAPGADETEIAIRKKAAGLARRILEEELRGNAGDVDYRLVGRLEGALRRAGAEDLIVLVTNGDGPPRPATGETLGESCSISVALEYRGHWVRVTRPRGTPETLEKCREEFRRVLNERASSVTRNPMLCEEGLSGSYPYECHNNGTLFALHLKIEGNLYYGDTCHHTSSGPEIL